MKSVFWVIFLSCLTLIALPFLGRTLDYGSPIFWAIRVPRVLTCFLVGGGLAVGGVVFQSLFRNDLATPYTLGLASSAALGAALSFFLGIEKEFLFWDMPTICAFLAAFGTGVVIYTISKIQHHDGPVILLLSGVAIGMTCSGLLLLIQFLSFEGGPLAITYWMMGEVNVVGLETFWSLSPLVVLTTTGLFCYARKLNLLNIGDTFAQSRGVDPSQSRRAVLLLGALLVSVIVAECGPIGFVGLITPHILKHWIKKDLRLLLPACFFGGGAFLGLCDLGARILLPHSLLPIGIVTALLGGPFFFFILLKKIR